MQIIGKLLELLPLQKGEGKNGTWKKQNIIVETEETYPKKICISIWGDKINSGILIPGETLNISFDIESREYNGKWYTDVKALKVESAGNQQIRPNIEETELPQQLEPENDLPF